jgi:arsenate reductase
MAEAFTNTIARERGLPIRGLSAGTAVGQKINPVAEEAMREIGVPMTGQHPKQLTQEMVNDSDSIITMGCGVDADACPARFLVTKDWGLDDPAGQPMEKVREIRDRIKAHVENLLSELGSKS